jgi:hypothetical protein
VTGLTVLYVLFLAGALTGAGVPCRTWLATRRAARAVPVPVGPRRRPRVRS